MPRNPEELIQDATAGDAAAVSALIERCLPDLRAFFRMRLGNRIRAKESDTDLVQSVCREVLQDIDQFEGRDPYNFRRWLFCTAQRKMADKQRFYGRTRRAHEAEAYSIDEHGECTKYVDLLSPSRVAVGREAAAEFEQVFDSLSDEQRTVVTSFKILGMSHAEIAQELGKSEGAVRMILHRALAHIGRVMWSD